MAEVPIPFVDEDLNTSDGTGAALTVAMLVIGFGVFAMAQAAGQNLYSTASNKFASATGIALDGSDSSSPEVV